MRYYILDKLLYDKITIKSNFEYLFYNYLIIYRKSFYLYYIIGFMHIFAILVSARYLLEKYILYTKIKCIVNNAVICCIIYRNTLYTVYTII